MRGYNFLKVQFPYSVFDRIFRQFCLNKKADRHIDTNKHFPLEENNI